MARDSVMVLDQARGNGWHIWNADAIEVLAGLPENSVGYSLFSPPFASLYTFSDDPRDVSNNADDRVFWAHYRFIIEGLYRALMPGRSVSIHCMDLPTSKTRDGSPFSGIGSVGYIAIQMGRRFCGAELKPTYWSQAVANLRAAEHAALTGMLFDRLEAAE